MPQPSDIVLDGTPYMLLPGSYRRASAGPPEGRTGRVVINDFVGGQRRALQLERDTSWDSPGVGPAFFGQGVEPWPWMAAHTDSVLRPVTAGQRVHTQALGNAIYLGIGRYVYRTVALTAGSWTDLTQVADLGAGMSITGLARANGYLAIACGAALDIKLLDPGTLVLTTLSAGLTGSWIMGYASRLVIGDPLPGNEGILRLTTGSGLDTRELDAPIVNMALHGGKVAIATRSALWLLGGRADAVDGVWIGEPEPVYTQLAAASDDFVFLCSFGGKLYTWLAGSAVEWNPNGGASKQGWRAAGLEGRVCYGGTVAGNMLVVSIQNRSGRYQLWAYDGTGWWLMAERESSPWVWPIALAGAGMLDLLAFRDGDPGVTYDTARMIPRSSGAPSYAAAGSFTTSLLDAGERDAAKSWRAIGATFATPEERGNVASTDPVTLSLAWSIDGGATWATAATATLSDPTVRTHQLTAELPTGAAVARSLQIRITFASVADWSPVLTGLWADYALLDRPPRRRRWSFAILARDASIQRDGSIATLSGRAQITALWQTWEDNQTLSFRDLDYDADPTERAVRITAIDEQVPKPSDAANWGAAAIHLQLLEL
jgi:hypothetical protein